MLSTSFHKLFVENYVCVFFYLAFSVRRFFKIMEFVMDLPSALRVSILYCSRTQKSRVSDVYINCWISGIWMMENQIRSELRNGSKIRSTNESIIISPKSKVENSLRTSRASSQTLTHMKRHYGCGSFGFFFSSSLESFPIDSIKMSHIISTMYI